MDFGKDWELKIREDVVYIRGRHSRIYMERSSVMKDAIETRFELFYLEYFGSFGLYFLIVYCASGALFSLLFMSLLEYFSALLGCISALLECFCCTSGVFFLDNILSKLDI